MNMTTNMMNIDHENDKDNDDEEDSGSFDSSSYFDEDDDSSLGSEMDVEAERLMNALQAEQAEMRSMSQTIAHQQQQRQRFAQRQQIFQNPLLMEGGGGTAAAIPPAPAVIKSPEECFQDHLAELWTLQNRQRNNGNGGNGSNVNADDSATLTGSGVLKLDDKLTEFLLPTEEEKSTSSSQNNVHSQRMVQICRDVVTAIQHSSHNHPQTSIQHVILGTTFLHVISEQQQLSIIEALVTHHSSTITYWKLGTSISTNENQRSKMEATYNNQNKKSSAKDALFTASATNAIWSMLNSVDWPCLTEFQMEGTSLLVEVNNTIVKSLMVPFLNKIRPTIKLFNILGFQLIVQATPSSTTTTDISSVPPSTTSAGLFDEFWTTVESIPQLDEIQLQCRNNDNSNGKVSLISTSTLDHLLKVKPKWWRLRLDGMGLTDTHLQILGAALKSSKDCKMNDLLSLRDNPGISEQALQQLYQVCMNKQRMGLVLSDDSHLEAMMDMVRPLNNLHRRLEYKENGENGDEANDGKFTSVDKWFDWFEVLSKLPWIDDKRKINYIWFTLLEQPEMISVAMHSSASPTVPMS